MRELHGHACLVCEGVGHVCLVCEGVGQACLICGGGVVRLVWFVRGLVMLV